MGRGQELLDAAREGDKRTVEKILGQICKRSGPFTSLRRGAGVNVQDDNGYTPLHHACLRGHKEIVQLLLSVDASPCVLDKKGANPLHLAAWKGDADVVSMLLAHNNPRVDINQLTSDQETPLLIAARSGYVDVVELLIAHGADVNIKNIMKESALDLAAYYGRVETVQHLLRVRPDLIDQYRAPKSRGRVFPSTPLHLASKNGNEEVVTALINAGVDPNVRTHNGTPLHEAACFGKASVVSILLSKRADLYAVDRRGKTVHDLLADYSEEATRRVKKVLKEFENLTRNPCDSEDDLPPFPLPDYSPTGYPGPAMKAPETQKNTNLNVGLLSPSPSTSSITKNHPQSFVKKLASRLGLKAKFNSAPNISNSAGLESVVESKLKGSDHKSTNTLLIGNSKFFNKILSKKEESGEVVCTDEFDTISLDRLGTLNRDSTVNRSNRSCPGFKTSLPNISENTELSDHDSVAESVVITEIECDNSRKDAKLTEAVNHIPKLNIFEPREIIDEKSKISTSCTDSANLLNECYEPYEVSKNKNVEFVKPKAPPVPLPRPTIKVAIRSNDDSIYENVVVESKPSKPVPAARTHVPSRRPLDEIEKKVLYENITILKEQATKNSSKPEPMTDLDEADLSPCASRSSTLSSIDSMVDETNLEDILLSEKSKSFRRSIQPNLYPSLSLARDDLSRTVSNASEFSDVTQASAIENIDCSGDTNDKSIYLSMTGTLPNKKTVKKKVLFRHKTFTNMEVDRNSTNVRDLPKWDSEFLKETLPNYHIRGTGHCMYKAPTVKEFIYIFNRETLYKNVEPFTKVPNDKRDSYYETAICFCKPRPPKHHNSFEDLLEKGPQSEEATVSIDYDELKTRREVTLSSFRCFCDAADCKLHVSRQDFLSDLVVKFSVIKKSISTPDITLDSSPNVTLLKMNLNKVKSSPSLEDPYAVVTLESIIARNREQERDLNNLSDSPGTPIYTTMSQPSTLTSNRPYSIKDISDVISLNDSISSADASLTNACGVPLRKSSSSEHSGHWSLQSCNSNVTIKSDASFKTCYEDSEEDSEGTLQSDDSSDAETIKSDVSTGKRPWVHSDSFRFGSKDTRSEMDIIAEESKESDSKFESGISVEGSESSSECEDDQDSGVPRAEDMSLGAASLERGTGVVGGVRSGSGRRRWDEAEGISEGDALSVSSAASSCAPLHMAHHHEYSKVSPTPPKKPPRRNLSVSPTHANSPSSGYSYELRTHARSQDDLDDIQGAKHYLKHGRSVDQYVDGKLSYSEYEENHNSPRIAPIPNPRPSLQKNRTQPVAITAMYENVVIKEQNPRRKLRRNNTPSYDNYEPRMENRVRKYSNQEKSSLESLLDDQSMNSPSDCEGHVRMPTSPTHYDQPPTPDHPPPSARQAENSIHERIRPLSQLIMEVVEEIRIRKKSQGDITSS